MRRTHRCPPPYPTYIERLLQTKAEMFAQVRTVQEEMATLDKMREEDPNAAKRMMDSGREMVELAKKGDLAQFVNLATNAQPVLHLD